METNTTQETSQQAAPRADKPTRAAAPPHVLVPAVDVLESADDIMVLADLPGVRNEDVTVHVEQDVLSLVAQRTSASGQPAVQYQRTFQVPRDIDPDRIEASSENGVLTLRFPRRASARPRTIAVASRR